MTAISLRARLLLLVLLAAAPAIALIAFSAWESRAAAAVDAQRRTRQLALVIAEEQNRIVHKARDLLLALSNAPFLRDPALLPRCSGTLAKIRQQNPTYQNLGVADAAGTVLCSVLPFQPGEDGVDRLGFQKTVNNRQPVGGYFVSRRSGLPTFTLSLPIPSQDGRSRRVLFASVSMPSLENLADELVLPPGTVVFLVDADGTVLSRHPDPQHEWMGKPVPGSGFMQSIVAKGCSGYAELPDRDGVMRLNAAEPLQRMEDKCAYVRVGVPREEIYREIDRNFRRDITALLVVTSLAFATAWFGAAWIDRGRRRLPSPTAKRLGKGISPAHTDPPDVGDETCRAAKRFDEMMPGVTAQGTPFAEVERALRRTKRAMTVISAGNHTMLRAKDEQSLLKDMCHMIVERAGYTMAWVGYAMDDDEHTVRPVAESGFEDGYLATARISWADNAFGRGPTGTAIRERRPMINRNFLTDPRMEPWREAAQKRGYASSIALPLLVDEDHCLGALNLYASEADAFDDAETELLGEAAADLAFGIGRLRDQVRRREAENADRIKSEFLANMSHELRTPLNAIIGFSDVLKDGLLGELTPRQREYLNDIHFSGRHLLSLINDILDLSKVEAGRMELRLEKTAVADLVANSLSVVREKAIVHGVALEEHVQGSLDPICVDSRKTKQIIYNLLANALKFTPDGGLVTLRARRTTRGEMETWIADRPNSLRLPLSASDFAEFLEIVVEDTGIGIEPEDTARLFRPFSQLDSSLARRYEGTGLGLVLVMKMAQLHGGTVAMSSEPGKGSCFAVWLPWRRETAAPVTPAVAAGAD
jgi:signal transduction histidine kinase